MTRLQALTRCAKVYPASADKAYSKISNSPYRGKPKERRYSMRVYEEIKATDRLETREGMAANWWAVIVILVELGMAYSQRG